MIKPLYMDEDGSFLLSDEDDDYTHVFIDKRSFEDVSNPLNMNIQMKCDLEDAGKAKEKIEKASKKLQSLDVDTKDAENRIPKLKLSIQMKIDQLEDAQDSAKNLIRMIREQSNAERDLRPKKAHTGYVPQRADQIRLTIGHDEDDTPIYHTGWKTMIETPYPVSLRLSDIEDIVIQDLSDIFQDCATFVGKCEAYDLSEEEVNECAVYNYDFHFNSKDHTNLWCVCLYSTAQIDLSSERYTFSDKPLPPSCHD